MSKKTLHQMIEDEDLEEDILECIKSTKDINKKDKKGNTALHLAVDEDSFAGDDVIKALIDAGADVNAKNRKGNTPLMVAIGLRDNNTAFDAIDLLIEAGAHLEDTDNEGNTPLLIAAQKNSFAIDVLIEKGANVNAKNTDGDTPLILTAKYWPDECDTLIDAGADVNAKNNEGYTAFHYAIESYLAVARLLEAGAEKPTDYPDGSSLLVKLLEFKRWELAIERIEAGDDVSDPLCVMYAVKKLDVLKALIKAGADVQVKHWDGSTALHWYISYDTYNGHDWKIIQFLLDQGVDLHAKDEDGKTALHYAIKDLHLFERLIRAGATGLNDTYDYRGVNCTLLGETIYDATYYPSKDRDKLILKLLQLGAVLVFDKDDPKKWLEKYLAKNYSVDKKLIRKLFKENQGK